MKTRIWTSLSMILVLVMVISACRNNTVSPAPTTAIPAPTTSMPIITATSPTPTTVAEEPIYLSIIWHQHQPVYYKNPDTGVYEKPWVRVHAAKDYVDMAAMLKDYPNIHVTFNLTPSLIRQLDDLSAGAKDLYWVM